MVKFILYRLLRILVVVYLALCLLVGVFQRRLIYLPEHATEAAMLAEAKQANAQPWRDRNGAIIGWKSADSGHPAAHRLVLFHGNAGYALQRSQYLRGFQRLGGGNLWEVYLFEYPGFGARPGKLGEEPFIAAGFRALEDLKAADSRPIYLLGESLGSGLACALAQRDGQDIAGLFLMTPYAQLGDVAALRFPILPVRLLLRDPWDNVAALRDYRGRLAMLIADQDEVVTAAQGQLLFDSYTGPKRMWTDADATHNTIDFSDDAAWWHEVSDFLLGNQPPP